MIKMMSLLPETRGFGLRACVERFKLSMSLDIFVNEKEAKNDTFCRNRSHYWRTVIDC